MTEYVRLGTPTRVPESMQQSVGRLTEIGCRFPYAVGYYSRYMVPERVILLTMGIAASKVTRDEAVEYIERVSEIKAYITPYVFKPQEGFNN